MAREWVVRDGPLKVIVIVFYTLALRKLLKKYPKGVDTKICCLKKMQKNGRTRGHVRPSELEMYIKSEKGL